MRAVELAIRDSAVDFRDVVWPAIAPALGGGTLDPLEGIMDNDTAQRFDMLAGVDAWQWLPSGVGVRGLASRVQWHDPAWRMAWPPNTFTVRRSLASGNDTEFWKRLHAIERKDEGLVYPHLTIQAYLDARGGPVNTVAAIRTEDLIRSIDPRPGGTRWTAVRGGNTMFIARWDELVAAGVPLWRWDDDPLFGGIALSRSGRIII
jgi:hypothetical protein